MTRDGWSTAAFDRGLLTATTKRRRHNRPGHCCCRVEAGVPARASQTVAEDDKR